MESSYFVEGLFLFGRENHDRRKRCEVDLLVLGVFMCGNVRVKGFKSLRVLWDRVLIHARSTLHPINPGLYM